MGHTVNFRTHKDSYKDKHSRQVSPEDWILFENTQEPIVDEDTWHTGYILAGDKPVGLIKRLNSYVSSFIFLRTSRITALARFVSLCN